MKDVVKCVFPCILMISILLSGCTGKSVKDEERVEEGKYIEQIEETSESTTSMASDDLNERDFLEDTDDEKREKETTIETELPTVETEVEETKMEPQDTESLPKGIFGENETERDL